jgi:hypothetical protein
MQRMPSVSCMYSAPSASEVKVWSFLSLRSKPRCCVWQVRSATVCGVDSQGEPLARYLLCLPALPVPSHQFSTTKTHLSTSKVSAPVPIQARCPKNTLNIVASSTHCQRRAFFTRFWPRRRLLSPFAFHRGPKQPASIVVVVVD